MPNTNDLLLCALRMNAAFSSVSALALLVTRLLLVDAVAGAVLFFAIQQIRGLRALRNTRAA